VVGGHRVSHDKPFEDIDLLGPGDEVIFTDAAGRHLYHVDRVEVVGNDAMWIVDQTAEKTGTLFACHPKGSTKQRIVAFLEHVETTV
jgi:sortase A